MRVRASDLGYGILKVEEGGNRTGSLFACGVELQGVADLRNGLQGEGCDVWVFFV